MVWLVDYLTRLGTHYEVTDGVVTKYYFAGSQWIALRKDGVLTYLLSDHLGSTSLVTDASGQVISQTKYKAWGEVRSTSGSELTKYQYTGQYSYEMEFGLLFYNARWVDPSLGRFAQADTIVPPGVQGLDRYAYMNNSPVNFVDPTGHELCDADGWCGYDNSSSGGGVEEETNQSDWTPLEGFGEDDPGLGCRPTWAKCSSSEEYHFTNFQTDILIDEISGHTFFTDYILEMLEFAVPEVRGVRLSIGGLKVSMLAISDILGAVSPFISLPGDQMAKNLKDIYYNDETQTSSYTITITINLRVKDHQTGAMWTSSRFALTVTEDNSGISQTQLVHNSYLEGLVRILENRKNLQNSR
ncbi:MAG TPA: RHS repeat-associated core domain-containing protein [Anaerolineales bacterium]|nr:RHS repeat-associated core domain-containing protein [Anaerolineales bacterium]